MKRRSSYSVGKNHFLMGFSKGFGALSNLSEPAHQASQYGNDGFARDQVKLTAGCQKIVRRTRRKKLEYGEKQIA